MQCCECGLSISTDTYLTARCELWCTLKLYRHAVIANKMHTVCNPLTPLKPNELAYAVEWTKQYLDNTEKGDQLNGPTAQVPFSLRASRDFDLTFNSIGADIGQLTPQLQYQLDIPILFLGVGSLYSLCERSIRWSSIILRRRSACIGSFPPHLGFNESYSNCPVTN